MDLLDPRGELDFRVVSALRALEDRWGYPVFREPAGGWGLRAPQASDSKGRSGHRGSGGLPDRSGHREVLEDLGPSVHRETLVAWVRRGQLACKGSWDFKASMGLPDLLDRRVASASGGYLALKDGVVSTD